MKYLFKMSAVCLSLSCSAAASLPFLLLLLFAGLAFSVAHVIGTGEGSTPMARGQRQQLLQSSLPLRQMLQSGAPMDLGRLLVNREVMQHEDDENSPLLMSKFTNHYACPPTSLDALRRRYGSSKSIWGEWSCTETRRFYRQQLPVSLRMDGVMGLSLEERARLAAEARHALRVYARERCHLPGRVVAMAFDGMRHWQTFGYVRWDGMTWPEVKAKYLRRARLALGPQASPEELEQRVYELIVERACATNELMDSIALQDLWSSLVLAANQQQQGGATSKAARKKTSRRASVMRKVESSVTVLLRSLAV